MKKTGDDYFDSEEFRTILNNYEEAVSSDQSTYMDVDDLTDIADYYHFTGKDQQANDAITLALSLYPNATLPNVFMARQALTTGDIRTAQEYISQIEQTDDPEYHYIKAELLLAQDKLEEADRYLRHLFTTVPPEEMQDFVMDVANIYSDYGLNDKAFEWIMRSKGDNSNDFQELMARILFGVGKYQDCARIFNKLLDKDPYCKRYWDALAHTQYMDEDYQGSITSSEYAIAIDPNDHEAIFNKANVLNRLGNYETAIQYYNRYLLLFPDDTLYLPQIYMELAFAHSALHHKEEALHYIEKTKDLDCDYIDTLVLRGHILLENDDVEEAEKVFRKAITRSDNDPHVIMRIIVSLYDNKYIKASYEMFKKFFSLYDTDNNILGHSYMALCCWDLGYTEEFLMHLRIAIEHNPREARQVLAHLFPENMAAKDYYHYMYQKLKK